jgi:hypothetical protein
MLLQVNDHSKMATSTMIRGIQTMGCSPRLCPTLAGAEGATVGRGDGAGDGVSQGGGTAAVSELSVAAG